MRSIRAFPLFVLLALCCAPAAHAGNAPALAFKEQVIGGDGRFNAFTDLVQYKGKWFYSYRSGTTRSSFDGQLRILRSNDGRHWAPAAAIAGAPGEDLRLGHFSIRPSDNALLLIAWVITSTPTFTTRVFVSTNGTTWDSGTTAADPNILLWTARWNGGTAYSVGQDALNGAFVRLYTSTDGVTWTTLVDHLFTAGQPSEADLLFTSGGTAFCLLRRTAVGASTAQLGTASPPYTSWTWQDLGEPFASPELVQLPDSRIFAAGRGANLTATVLDQVNVNLGTLTLLVTLDTSPDTGYPGLVFANNLLWMSYYAGDGTTDNVFLGVIGPGEGIGSGKVSAPGTVKFGGVKVSHGLTRALTIRNASSKGLFVNVTAPGDPFSIASGGGSRFIPAGGQRAVRIRFAPPGTGTFSSDLVINSTDPNNTTVTVHLTGSGK